MATGKVKRLGIALVLLSISAVTLGWLFSVGNPMVYLTHSVSPGQFLYILSKLAGLLALVLICVQVILMLIKAGQSLIAVPGISSKRHMQLGLTTFALCLLHIVLIFSAIWLRQGKAPWGLFLPDFAAGYYKLHLSLGVVAFYLLCAGIVAGWKLRSKKPAWKAIHMMWPLAVGLAYWHSLSIGSESRTGIVLVTLWFLAAGICAALLVRMTAAYKARGFWQAKDRPIALRDRG